MKRKRPLRFRQVVWVWFGPAHEGSYEPLWIERATYLSRTAGKLCLLEDEDGAPYVCARQWVFHCVEDAMNYAG